MSQSGNYISIAVNSNAYEASVVIILTELCGGVEDRESGAWENGQCLRTVSFRKCTHCASQTKHICGLD